jgi:hypothetical protein
VRLANALGLHLAVAARQRDVRGDIGPLKRAPGAAGNGVRGKLRAGTINSFQRPLRAGQSY